MTARAVWSVDADPHTGRYVLPAALLTGPGVDDLVHAIVTTLADDQLDAFLDYVAARKASALAPEDGWAADSELNAWDALVAELPRTVRLVQAEGRLVGQLLDETCGRVGMRAA